MGNENMDMLCDKIRGSLFGGAVGDALGYPIEFFMESEIFSKYGPQGIQEYTLDEESGKALISDDTAEYLQYFGNCTCRIQKSFYCRNTV